MNLFNWLSGGLTPELIEEAGRMLWELEEQRLEVILTPAPEKKHSCHCIRTVQNSNPVWYKRFCHKYQSSRVKRSAKSNTRIKREHTVKYLTLLTRGELRGEYSKRLLVEVRSNLEERTKQETEHSPEDWLIDGKLYF